MFSSKYCRCVHTVGFQFPTFFSRWLETIIRKPCVANLRKPVSNWFETLWVQWPLECYNGPDFPWLLEVTLIMFMLSVFGFRFPNNSAGNFQFYQNLAFFIFTPNTHIEFITASVIDSHLICPQLSFIKCWTRSKSRAWKCLLQIESNDVVLTRIIFCMFEEMFHDTVTQCTLFVLLWFRSRAFSGFFGSSNNLFAAIFIKNPSHLWNTADRESLKPILYLCWRSLGIYIVFLSVSDVQYSNLSAALPRKA